MKLRLWQVWLLLFATILVVVSAGLCWWTTWPDTTFGRLASALDSGDLDGANRLLGSSATFVPGARRRAHLVQQNGASGVTLVRDWGKELQSPEVERLPVTTAEWLAGERRFRLYRGEVVFIARRGGITAEVDTTVRSRASGDQSASRGQSAFVTGPSVSRELRLLGLQPKCCLSVTAAKESYCLKERVELRVLFKNESESSVLLLRELVASRRQRAAYLAFPFQVLNGAGKALAEEHWYGSQPGDSGVLVLPGCVDEERVLLDDYVDLSVPDEYTVTFHADGKWKEDGRWMEGPPVRLACTSTTVVIDREAEEVQASLNGEH